MGTKQTFSRAGKKLKLELEKKKNQEEKSSLEKTTPGSDPAKIVIARNYDWSRDDCFVELHDCGAYGS